MNLRSEVRIVDAPLTRPIANARGRWTVRRAVLLELCDEDGRIGRGEASPLPGYSPDDADECARALASPDSDLARLPAARFARETALADLEAQRRKVSVASYLAGAKVTRTIERAGLVDLASPALEEEGRALVGRGVRTIKAKIGIRPLSEDLAALAHLRRALGGSIRLRLDANGAFDAAGARAVLAELARVEPELVEEPARGEALLSLGACAVPWAADESLQDARIAERLLDSPCAAFVVKPQLWGLHGARALALAAQARKKGVIVTHMFDGPIALAAACELALSLPEPPLACGLDPHPSLASFGPMRVMSLERPGVVAPHDGAGLGVL